MTNAKPGPRTIDDFFTGKPPATRELFDHFVQEFRAVAPITLHPAKTMIGIAAGGKRVAYVTQFGKSFIHVVFPFERPYDNNLCFQKIARVPGDEKQFNHHFRMLNRADVNDEVRKFMRLAYAEGKK